MMKQVDYYLGDTMADCFMHRNLVTIGDTVKCLDCGATGKKAEVNNMSEREKLRGVVSKVKHEDKYWAIWITGDDRRFSKFGKCHIPDLKEGDEVDFAVYPSKDGNFWNISALGRIKQAEQSVGGGIPDAVEDEAQADVWYLRSIEVKTKSIEYAINLLALYNKEKFDAMTQAQKEDELYRIASSIRDWIVCPDD